MECAKQLAEKTSDTGDQRLLPYTLRPRVVYQRASSRFLRLERIMKCGAIVLCGGKSSRMGRSKAWLPFGSETMLARTVRLIEGVVERIVVVAALHQDLPSLPAHVQVVRDLRPERGPLEGLAAGLRAFGDTADAVYASGCDVPLLVPAFVERMFELLGQADVAVPRDDQFHHPLAAVYRTSVLPHIESLLQEDRRRPVFLFERVPTHEVPIDELRQVDPELATLMNLNRPEDYEAALRRAGIE